MATAAWLLGLFYYTKFRHLKEPAKEQWGVSFVFKFIAMFVGSILLFYVLTKMAAPQRPPGLSLVQALVIGC